MNQRIDLLRSARKSGSRKRKSAMVEVAAAIAGAKVSTGLSKPEGMSLAYDAQRPDRDQFEAVIHYVALTTPPEQEFSANEVWQVWRDVLCWPEPAKRQFVGPAMRASATKYGWTTVVGETQNTSGNGHAEREVNRTYRSLIFDPNRQGGPVP